MVLEFPIVRDGFKIVHKINKSIFSGESKFQKIDVLDVEYFGKCLFLDRDINICESDSVIYDKAMVDPIFHKNKNVKRVMILGGGDGGVLREVLTHNVDEAIMVEIDKEVVDICRKYIPKICGNAFEDKRTKLIIDDASKVIGKHGELDAVISDLIDPERIAKAHGRDFYEKLLENVHKSLKKGGVLSMQVGSYFEEDIVKFIGELLKKHFIDIEFKQVFIPAYVEPWIFASAIKK